MMIEGLLAPPSRMELYGFISLIQSILVQQRSLNLALMQGHSAAAETMASGIEVSLNNLIELFDGSQKIFASDGSAGE